jgi:hypothetical protein
MCYYLIFLLNKVISIVVVSALTAFGGSLPLIGLLYWHYKKTKINLEKRLVHYNKSVESEEKNLSNKKEILEKFAQQGIDFDNLIKKFNDRLLFKDKNEVTAFKIFREVEQESWESSQRIEKIKSQIFYIENFSFSFYIWSLFNKKYFNKDL